MWIEIKMRCTNNSAIASSPTLLPSSTSSSLVVLSTSTATEPPGIGTLLSRPLIRSSSSSFSATFISSLHLLCLLKMARTSTNTFLTGFTALLASVSSLSVLFTGCSGLRLCLGSVITSSSKRLPSTRLMDGRGATLLRDR